MHAFLPDFLIFASDAALLAMWGGGFLLLALGALVMERRRMKRAQIHRVGWMPWTGLFMACAMIGGIMLAVGLPAALRG